MIKLDKTKMLVERCNVMGIMKFDDNELEEGEFSVDGIGVYKEVKLSDMKRTFDKMGETLLSESDIVLDTGRTKFSGYFVMKAMKICQEMDWDWDFRIYESVDKLAPIILINYEDVAFIIAPRQEEEINNEYEQQLEDTDIRQ